MPELIIGAVLGFLTLLSVFCVLLSIYALSKQRQLEEKLDELDDRIHEDAEAFGASVQQGFSMLEGVIKALASKHGLAWDADAGEWRRVQ